MPELCTTSIVSSRKGTVEYKDYLETDHWKKLAEETKRLAGYRCQVCNSERNLNAHHRTYERKGDELQGDLVCLCDHCHALFHRFERIKESYFSFSPCSKNCLEEQAKAQEVALRRMLLTEIELNGIRRREKIAKGILLTYKNDPYLWDRLADAYQLRDN